MTKLKQEIALEAVTYCLRTLARRASHGVKAKPTVPELNAIMKKLVEAKEALQ